MKLEIKDGYLHVTKEKGDPSFRRSEWGSAESRLLYHIKKILNDQGFNFIKKRMGKDGHLVDEDQLYIRPQKKPKNDEHNIAIFNNHFAIYDAGEEFTQSGFVKLLVLKDYYKGKV